MTSWPLARWVGMTDDHDEPLVRPDGHRYEKPESRDTSKEVVYAVLALLVVILAVLIATGTVPIFPE